MLTNPHFGIWRNDIGGYHPDIWFDNLSPSETHYCNDRLIAILFSTAPKLFSDFAKLYNATGPRNRITYFLTEEECSNFIEVLQYIYEQMTVYGKTWLSVTKEILASKDSPVSSSEASETVYTGLEKTYTNLQGYQGIPVDINYTNKEAKDINMGHITENPFKPGQSKKHTHYTFL